MSEDDEIDVGPVHALLAIPEPQRSEYVKEIVKSLADALENITKMKAKIKQAKALKAFLKDLEAKRDEIEPALFYIIKPEFRETVIELLERFSVYVEKKVE